MWKADDKKDPPLCPAHQVDQSMAAMLRTLTRHVGKKLKQDLARSPKRCLDGKREGWGWGGVGNFPTTTQGRREYNRTMNCFQEFYLSLIIKSKGFGGKRSTMFIHLLSRWVILAGLEI